MHLTHAATGGGRNLIWGRQRAGASKRKKHGEVSAKLEQRGEETPRRAAAEGKSAMRSTEEKVESTGTRKMASPIRLYFALYHFRSDRAAFRGRHRIGSKATSRTFLLLIRVTGTRTSDMAGWPAGATACVGSVFCAAAQRRIMQPSTSVLAARKIAVQRGLFGGYWRGIRHSSQARCTSSPLLGGRRARLSGDQCDGVRAARCRASPYILQVRTFHPGVLPDFYAAVRARGHDGWFALNRLIRVYACVCVFACDFLHADSCACTSVDSRIAY